MNNNSTKLLLLVGILLVIWGLGGNKLSNVIKPSVPESIDVMELTEPNDPDLNKEANDVVVLIKSYNNSNKNDFKKLRNLMLDLGRLVQLDGEDVVIKNTDEIRQANSIAGPMLRLDIKGKYPDFVKESEEVMKIAIGDDSIALSPELRSKAVDGFNALAWAYNEGGK